MVENSYQTLRNSVMFQFVHCHDGGHDEEEKMLFLAGNVGKARNWTALFEARHFNV